MRLWILISGYDDPAGLERACRSVRRIWSDADRFPIVYADGAYERFPHASHRSSFETFDTARRWASLIVEWPIAAPTEYLKRTSYWIGDPGDYALILDTDEEIMANGGAGILERLGAESYLLPIRDPAGRGDGWVHRLFRVEAGIHHWGAHEAVFAGGGSQRRRASAVPIRDLTIVHHPCSADRRRAKQEYYRNGIQADESSFRQLVGV